MAPRPVRALPAAPGGRGFRALEPGRDGPPPAAWHSPNAVIAETPLTALRDFTDGATDAVVPTLVLPPQAGHHSSIVDFSPRQSQLRTIREAGLTRAYALEWKGATAETRGAGIEDVLADVEPGSSASAARSIWSATARAAGSRPSTPPCTPRRSTR